MTILTMQQFLKNPTGKSSAAFARRDLIIANLEKRFATLYKKRAKDFKVETYSYQGTYIFKFKIPSEKYEGLKYDVVIQFIPIGNSGKDLTLNNYALKIFSNSPAMMFTYAYVFNKNEMIIDFLIDKCSKRSLNEPPKIKNPQEMFGFEKSVYFSLLYIKQENLHAKVNIKPSPLINIKGFKKDIMTAEDKFEEYNKYKNGIENKKFDKLYAKTDTAKAAKELEKIKKAGGWKRKRHRNYKRKF